MKKIIMSVLLTIFIAGLSLAGTITVNSPNGGEEWIRGSVHNIAWNSSDLTNPVKITLWKNNVLVGLIIKDQPVNGSYSWTVGSYQVGTAVYGTDYKIKIREQGGVAFTTEDMSNGNFRIKSRFIRSDVIKMIKKIVIKEPHSAETLVFGKTKLIKWNTIGVSGRKVSISIYWNGVTNGYIIAEKIPVEQKQFEWKIGKIWEREMYNHIFGKTTGCKIRVLHDDGGDVIVPPGGAWSKEFTIHKKFPMNFNKIKK